MIDGEPVGGINRIPPQDDIRSNMHVGGKPTKTTLTKRDIEICQNLRSTLKDKNLFFVGIDVIGDYLTEINVTSPTGIQELEHFNRENFTELVWVKLEEKWKIL